MMLMYIGLTLCSRDVESDPTKERKKSMHSADSVMFAVDSSHHAKRLSISLCRLIRQPFVYGEYETVRGMIECPSPGIGVRWCHPRDYFEI